MVKQTVVSGAIRIVLDERLQEDDHERRGGNSEELLQRRGSMSDWGLNERDHHGGKYHYVRVYPVDEPAPEGEEGEEEVAEPRGPLFATGERIHAKFEGGKHFYPGKVLRVHHEAPFHYHVLYDDGDEEDAVPESHIFGKDGKGKQPAGPHALRHKRDGNHSKV